MATPTKPFCIVYFEKDETYEAVCSKWLDEDGDCWWPSNIKNRSNLVKKIQREEEINPEEMDAYKAQVLKYYDTFLAAKKNADLAQREKPIQSSTDADNRGRSKRVKKPVAKYAEFSTVGINSRSSDSETSSDSANEREMNPRHRESYSKSSKKNSLSDFPIPNENMGAAGLSQIAVVKEKLSNPSTKKNQQKRPRLNSPSDDSYNLFDGFEEFNSQDLTEASCSTPTTSARSQSSLSVLPRPPSTANSDKSVFKDTVDDSTVIKKILKEVFASLELLKINQRQQTTLLDLLVSRSNAGTVKETSSELEGNLGLPLKSLAALEIDLKDQSTKSKLINIYSLVGGGSLANVVNRIFHRILDDEVAQHFCFRGQNAGKRAFEHLGTCKLIEECVRRTAEFGDAKESDIEDKIKNLLKKAPAQVMKARQPKKHTAQQPDSGES
ncbi:uncharacterized protein LOC116931803 [Daphnia magna]|uniref:uncharacterized protein LOC116931803 n=1 Tax=Daphnia magna TaxID=35525 RepID=UPI001E1BA7D2|nr:uncharacterized protein LOC116931803 [Daphnia magna]